MIETNVDTVKLIEESPEYTVVQSGDFSITVDEDKNDIRIARISNADHSKSVLSFSLGDSQDESSLQVTIASIEVKESNDDDLQLIIDGRFESYWYTLDLAFPSEHPGTFTYDLSIDGECLEEVASQVQSPEFTVKNKSCNDNEDAIVSYLDGSPDSNPAAGTDDLNQFVYAALKPLDATILYMADWPKLDEYFQLSETSMHDTVASPPGPIGFVPPDPEIKSDKINKNTDVSFRAGIVTLTPEILDLEDSQSISKRFVQNILPLYDCLDRQSPRQFDWPSISQDTLSAIWDEKNYFEYEDTFYPGGVELVTTMSIITPFKSYAEKFENEKATALSENVIDIVDTFYDSSFTDATGSTGIIANSPAPVTLTHVDAWYLFWPIIQVAEYALNYDIDQIKEMVIDTADVIIDVGQAMDYEFPMWIDVDNLSPHEPDNSQWDGYQYDCTGAYVYLMIQYYDLTKEQRFLEEAKAAAQELSRFGFEFPYEFTTTPLTPLALVRLADRTGDSSYIDTSYIGLANVLRHAYFFNPEYGSFEGRNIFLLNEAMPPKGYKGNYFSNALEEWSLLYYLDRYLREGGDNLTSEAQQLTAALLRHKGTSIADSLPQFHPDKSKISEDISPQSGRRTNHDWALPLEPFGVLGPDFEELGEIGQDLYGSGVYPEVANQQYHPLNRELTLFVNGPVDIYEIDEYAWMIETLGTNINYHSEIRGPSDALIDCSVRRVDEFSDEVQLSEEVETTFDGTVDGSTAAYGFTLNAGERYIVRKTVPKRAIVVRDFTVSEDEIVVGEETTISMTVCNTAHVDGTFEVPLSVGPDTKTKTLNLSKNGSTDVSFTVSPDEAGTYNVQIAHENRALSVVPDEEI